MILMMYGQGVYKEYLLPNLTDADYTICLEKEIFPIVQDMELALEVDGDGWRVKEDSPLRICPEAGEMPAVLKDGRIYDLDIGNCGRIQMIVLDADIVLPVLEKIDLTRCGELTVGRNPGNEIVYSFMELVSKYHAVIRREGDGWYIRDVSANGIFCGGRRIEGGKKLLFGEKINIFGLHCVYLGEMLAVGTSYGEMTLKEHLPVCGISRETVRSGSEVREKHGFNRSPRHIPELNTGQISIEAPPAKKEIHQKPAFLTIGPAFTMAIPMLLGSLMMILAAKSSGRSSGAFMFTGVITALGSATLGVFWGIMNLKYARSRQTEEEQIRFNSYGNYLIHITEEVKEKYQQNRSVLEAVYPDTSVCVAYDQNCPALWNRNFTHEDFLFHRMGLGDEPFQAEIKIPPRKFTMYEDILEQKPYEIKKEYEVLHQVPAGVDLMKHKLIGLVGGPGREGAVELMHVIAAQTAANNCYTDVKMVFIYDKKQCRDGEWECMRWFPHVWNQGRRTRYLAADKMEASDLFYELSGIFRRREEEQGGSEKKELIRPYYLLFVSHPGLLEGELIQKYIHEPSEKYGLTTLLLADRPEELPNKCELIIRKDTFCSAIYAVKGKAGLWKTVMFDRISPDDLEQMGRRLLGLEVSEVEENSDIPGSLDFFEMYGIRKKEELGVIRRWKKNRTYDSMRALVGKRAGGQDCFLDIHEKYHGPHGLIAGTTGSGKSEMLQTYILSLAVNYSPDDIGFFLIDFKGGGMAELFSDLPHLVGKISNLSGNQVRRAMISIKSENTRRQKIFREYGVNNINLYTRLYKNQEARIPVPHLFIVIDEFAELKKEEPDFMRELISVAQVGRSLGVHLILATQKPSGTVDDNIWSNSKFRICLRVQDRQDSMDMLHKPDAAFLTQAGRCFLQVGNDEIYEQFQSGYSGAAYDAAGGAGAGRSAMMVTRTGKPAVVGRRIRSEDAVSSKDSIKELSQLEVLIDYLGETARENHYGRSMQLWLPVLPQKLLLAEIGRLSVPYSVPESSGQWELKTMVGLLDDPVHQSQQPLYVDFSANGHCAVCGTVVSGKSTFLQTLVYGLICSYTARELNLYLLDFSSRMLAPYADAPQVGGIIFENEEDKTGKFFYMIRQLIAERKELFGGGNYSQYVRAYGVKIPAVVIVIDHVAGFREKTNGVYDEELIRISREGVGYGIFLALSSAGFGMTEIPSRLGDNIRSVMCLEMGDKYKYMDVLHTTRIPIQPEADVKGRGITSVDGSLLEFQTALALESSDDFERGERLEEFSRMLAATSQGETARKIPEIPKDPRLSDLERLPAYRDTALSGQFLPFAYNLEDASLYSINLSEIYCYTILGTPRSGRKNAMKVMLAAALYRKADICIMEFTSSDFRSYAGEERVKYVSKAGELFGYFKELTPVFAGRNQKKKELLDQGLDEEEIFGKMRELFPPVFLFIADLADFFRTVYTPGGEVGSMSGFVENIIGKGSLHNIYFIGALDMADAAGCPYKAYNDYVNYKKGICLGRLTGQRIFSFPRVPYAQQSKPMKRGLAAEADEEGGGARYIVIPSARR